MLLVDRELGERDRDPQLPSGCESGRLVPYFSYEILKKKENNMYFPFGKSHSRLLDVKCINLNSPLIPRMSLAKQIDTFSIILKLYKSQHY